MLVLILFISVALLPLISSCATQGPPTGAKTFKVGLISSVTGPMAPAFKNVVDAAKPSAELINQRGGVTIGGEKYLVEIVTEDDQSSPPGAVAAANKLINAGVKFVIAPMFIPANLAIATVCEEAKILRVVPNCIDPTGFGPPNKYCFDAQITLYNFDAVYNKMLNLYPQVKKIALIPPDDPGAIVPRDLAEKEIKKRGMQLVFNEAYKIPTEDFYPIITKALEAKPDGIECLFAIIPWAKGIIESARQMGFEGPIWCVSSFGDTFTLKAVLDPKYAYNVFHANPYVYSPKMPDIVKDFGKLVEQYTKTKMTFDHVLTLQSLMLIKQGVEKANSFDTDKVVSVLEALDKVETPYGSGTMRGKDLIGINRLVVQPIPFSRFMKDGSIEFEFLK